MAGMSQVSDFEIEMSILRKWDVLRKTDDPKWRWFRQHKTERWEHRLACILAWSDSCQQNPWMDLIIKEAQRLDHGNGYKMLNVIGSQNCLEEDEKVRMFDGSVKPIKDIMVGDSVLGPDGRERRVLERFEGSAPLYEIMPKVGRSWKCTGNHKLVLDHHGKRGRKQKRFREIIKPTVEEYLDFSDYKKKRCGQITGEANDEGLGFPIDPRLYGLWLGDGNRDQPVITVANNEQEVLNYMFSCHDNISRVSPQTNAAAYRFKDHPVFRRIVRRSTKTGEKRILREAFRMTKFNRRLLLAGLIDSDGHLSKNCQYIFTQRREGLALDVMELAQGLGFRCSITKRWNTCSNAKDPAKKHPYYQVAICGDIDIIPTLRKKRRKGPAEHNRRKHGRTGINVRPCGEGKYVGITVSDDHLFCLDDYTITNNSSKSFSMSRLMMQLFIEDPNYTGVYVASPYKEATTIGIWGYMKEAFRECAPHMGWDADRYLKDSKGLINIKDGDRAGFVRIVAVDDVGMLQGKKPRSADRGGLHLLIEESGTFKKNPGAAVWDVLQNLMGQERFNAWSTCNFKDIFGLDGMLCKPMGKDYGDLDIDKDQSWDSVRNGFTLRLDGERSPNVLANQKRKKFKYIVGQEDIDAMIAAGHGPKSPKYMEQIRSFPLTGMSQFTVTTLTKLQAGRVFNDEIYRAITPTRWAFADPGLGGDEYCLATAGIKTTNAGKHVIVPEHFEYISIEADKFFTADDVIFADRFNSRHEFKVGDKMTPEIQGALKVAEKLSSYGIASTNFGYDASMRASVQRAHDMFIGHRSLSMDYIGPAEDLQMPSGIGSARDLYSNFITYLWFLAADMCENGIIREGDPWQKGFSQLSSRLWEWSGSRRKMESKDTYKQRNSNESPNEADALVGLLYLIYKRSGIFHRGTASPQGTTVLDALSQRLSKVGTSKRLLGLSESRTIARGGGPPQPLISKHR